MRLALVVGLVTALAGKATADELVTTGALVMTKKGPAFRGSSRAAGAQGPAASFDVKQKSYRTSLHRENLEPGQDVRLGGGAREMELSARSTGADGAALESTWVLSGKAKRSKTKRAVGEHRRDGRLVAREVITVKRKSAVREVTTYGERGAQVRREELRRASKKQARRGKR